MIVRAARLSSSSQRITAAQAAGVKCQSKKEAITQFSSGRFIGPMRGIGAIMLQIKLVEIECRKGCGNDLPRIGPPTNDIRSYQKLNRLPKYQVSRNPISKTAIP